MLKTVEIDGKTYRWKDLLRLRREQSRDSKRPRQQTLFPLREDMRPTSQQSADGRFTEPTLFKVD